MKIFGYEPAAWAGALQGVLGVLVVFNVFGLNADTSTLVQTASAALFALATAFFTKKVNLALVVGALQAVFGLLVGFGLDGAGNLGDPQVQAALIASVQVALAGFLRQNTEPAEEPGFRSEPLHSEPLEPDYHPEEVVAAPAPAVASAPLPGDDGLPQEQPYI
jgi:hypothetical protein